MAERTPAPGRVEVESDQAWPLCQSGCVKVHPGDPRRDGDPFPDPYPTLAKAADALREHLRTEHADLWNPCRACGGAGTWAGVAEGCNTCDGRGYIERITT